jgi:hypothetical protein
MRTLEDMLNVYTANWVTLLYQQKLYGKDICCDKHVFGSHSHECTFARVGIAVH